MVKERNLVNLHIRDIDQKKLEIAEIKLGVEEVELELKTIKENE